MSDRRAKGIHRGWQWLKTEQLGLGESPPCQQCKLSSAGAYVNYRSELSIEGDSRMLDRRRDTVGKAASILGDAQKARRLPALSCDLPQVSPNRRPRRRERVSIGPRGGPLPTIGHLQSLASEPQAQTEVRC